MLRTTRLYTEYKFTGIIPYDNALAKALQWLYDESEFEDDENAEYNMDTRLPLYDFMTLVVLFIGSAHEEYGVTKLREIIQLLEEGKNPSDWREKNPTYEYENNDLLINKMETCTTEVILWAAYIYCLFRSELNHNNPDAKCYKAKDVLYDLFKKKSYSTDEGIQDHFLMQHRDATMRLIVSNWLSEKNEQKKGPADRKPDAEQGEKKAIESCEERKIEPTNAFGKIIFFCTVLSTAYDSTLTNQTGLSELICLICGGQPSTFQPRISKLADMVESGVYDKEVINSAKKLVKKLRSVPRGENAKIQTFIDSIMAEFSLKDV